MTELQSVINELVDMADTYVPQDEILSNVTYEDAINIVASSGELWYEDLEIPDHYLTNILAESNQEHMATELAVSHPDVATELLDHLLYWREERNRI